MPEGSDSINVTTTNENADLPRPPRGRRAAIRPAGPPIVEAERTIVADQSEPTLPHLDAPAATPAPKRRAPRSTAKSKAAVEAREPAKVTEKANGTESVKADELLVGQPATSQSVPEATVPAAQVAVLEQSHLAETPTPANTPAESPADISTKVSADSLEHRQRHRQPAHTIRAARSRRPASETRPMEQSPDETHDQASDAEEIDEVAAALAAVTQATAEQHSTTTEVATDQIQTQAVLDSLVAAIASAPADTHDDQTDLSDEATDESGDSADDEAAQTDEVSTSPKRRRRRGGRRRRRSGSGVDNSASEAGVDEADDDSAEQSADTAQPAGEGEADDHSDAETAMEGSHRRRRRRRRRGEDSGASEDDPNDVVVRVREPRSRASVLDEVSGIEGSTRLEAKKQRRREGRAEGRRRAPILSEAEFLARRESVHRIMVIRQRPEYTQLAVLEDGLLVEHYVDRKASTSLIGNIYLGKVQNVLPSMEAAFVDIGRGRNAVLYAGEVDWAAFSTEDNNHQRKIEEVLKPGQSILVQVSKDPVGAKGARLTGHVSIPGRFVVYSPDGQLSGISRKLPDAERHRLKEILSEAVDEEASVIVRTAAEGASQEELVRDVERLKAQWQVIEKKVKNGSAPQQLYAEPDLTLRIVRDLFTEDFAQLMIAGDGGPEDAYDVIEAYVQHVAPHLAERLSRWDASQGDPFTQYRVDEQIAKALERKVFLPSGGSLVIDRTEAMTVIDVNTGKFTGTGGNLEETVTRNNLEAAEEIVRQLRLRDLGGIVVVDFIDMVLPANRELLLRRLVECLGRDRTRHQVSEVTSLGLVQLTRKKIGTGLAEAFTEVCPACGGRGYVRHDEPVDSQAPADGGERHYGGRGNHGRADHSHSAAS